MSNSKEVATKENTALETYNYGEEAGAGFEGTSNEDLSVPFLNVLQAISPEIDEIEGAKAGQIFNTVTKELTDGEKGIIFIPCHTDVAMVEWIPRESGGGFVGQHEKSSQIVVDAIANNNGSRMGTLKTPEGNDLIETHYVYGLILSEDGKGSEGFAVFSFTSTKIKPKKDWFTAMYTLKGKPPLFANRALIKTKKQKNDHGSFYNVSISPLKETWVKSLIDPKQESDLLMEAKEFREMVVAGMAKADFSQEKGNAPAQKDENGDVIPF